MSRIEDFLREDIGEGDITSDALVGDRRGAAAIIARQECVVAGLEEASEAFTLLGLRVTPLAKDGERVRAGTAVLSVEGALRSILAGERVALNLLMRMSGIATATNDVLWACRERNPDVIVAATRKTTPGFRHFEKKAVMLGGGDPHRFGLDDAVLIKDNHLAVVGSITEAVARGRKVSFTKKVEVEVVSLDGAREAALAGADIILLDNMSPKDAAACRQAVKVISPGIIVEASGGITPSTAPEYAEAVDIISLGWLTHSVRAADLSMDITALKD
ncbi:MAG: carboxylating nicotinate-nucleotide diphosphorylase [Methanomassiliicoccus sp.]|nr:carboxylating nicotinate-nucleotide diphosphorylase [Methanomassiliicoccus sp.]